MSTPLSEVVVDERNRRFRRLASFSAASRNTLVVIWAGRVVVVWVPALTLSAGEQTSIPSAVGAATLLSAIWLAALRSAVAAVHFTLGTPIAAAIGTLSGLIVVSAVDLWVPGLQLNTVRLLELTAAVFGLWTCWELVVKALLSSKGRVMIIGTTAHASAVLEALDRAREAPFTVVGMVDDTPKCAPLDYAPLLGSVADLPAVVAAQQPDIIVLADGAKSSEALDRLVDAAGGFRVVGLPEFYEHAFGRVPVRHLSAAWFMSVLHLYQPAYTRFAKRFFDIVVVLLALIVTAPVLAAIVLTMSLSRGPIIFRQRRLGERGREFTDLQVPDDARRRGAAW